MTVMEAFESEKEALLALPENPFPVYDRQPVHVGKTPYVRFDLNDYSVPHKYVKKTLVVEATVKQISIMDGLTKVASHSRSFDKEAQIENPEHIETLVAVKQEASKHRGMNRLLHVAPSSKQFFGKAAERGHNMGRLTQCLIYLLNLYGAAELEAALTETLAAGSMHSTAVQQTLERRRRAKGLKEPVPLRFNRDREVDEITVVPKSLDKYDNLVRQEDQNS